MAARVQRTERRTDALSRDRVVEAAIDILDADGENARLFPALTARLSTGPGAIYHHIANKSELLAVAAHTVIVPVLSVAASDGEPREAIRAISLGMFDTIAAHPWLGSQLSREPGQPAVLELWQGVGMQLHALGVVGTKLSDAGSALVNYILGSAAAYAAGPGRLSSKSDRTASLQAIATQWQQRDPTNFPLVQEMARLLPEHDDREQFLAGVNIFLAGISASA